MTDTRFEPRTPFDVAKALEAKHPGEPLGIMARDYRALRELLLDLLQVPLTDDVEAAVRRALEAGHSKTPHYYRTKSGRVLTDADIQALADEAERGYDVEHLRAHR